MTSSLISSLQRFARRYPVGFLFVQLAAVALNVALAGFHLFDLLFRCSP